MIVIKNISIRNFLSIGETPKTLYLDNDMLTLVIGENRDGNNEKSISRNGCGKSTILNAISFAL